MDALDCSCAFAPGLNLRVIDRAGEPWFVAADVCAAIAHGNPTIAMASVDADDQAKLNLGSRTVNVVSESGLYSLLLRSRKPEAQRFRKWVTSEVLPAIRKTGSYTVPQKAQVFDQPAALGRDIPRGAMANFYCAWPGGQAR